MKQYGRTLATAVCATVLAGGCVTVIEATAPGTGNPSGAGSFGWSGSRAEQKISADGRYVLFAAARSETNSTLEIYRHDNTTGATVRVSRYADGVPAGSSEGQMSADGRYVVFITDASIASNDTNNDDSAGADVYLRDMVNGSVSRVSLKPDGSQFGSNPYFSIGSTAGLHVSDDGRYVVFANIEDRGRTYYAYVHVRDRVAGTTTPVHEGYVTADALSGDGLHVAIDPHFINPDTGEYTESYVVDWKTGTTFGIGECQAAGLSLSSDGRYVAGGESGPFQNPACEGGVYRWDRVTGARTLVAASPDGYTLANGNSSMSADGSLIAFITYKPLDPADSNDVDDVYVKDLLTGRLQLASTGRLGEVGDGQTTAISMSGDGHYIAVESEATNLLSSDTDGLVDVFTISAVRPKVVSVTPGAVAGGSTRLSIAGEGFRSDAFVVIGGTRVTASDVAVRSGTSIEVTVVVEGAAPGRRDVIVVNPGRFGNATGWCFGCLDVRA